MVLAPLPVRSSGCFHNDTRFRADGCWTRTLVHAFPQAGLGVAVAVDGVLYESDVYGASRSAMYSTRRHGPSRMEWGDRAVLVLIGIRLGIEGVNPLYYNTIKVCTWFMELRITHSNATCCTADAVYLSPICRHRRRSALLFILLRRLAGRQPLLLGSSSRASCGPSALASS